MPARESHNPVSSPKPPMRRCAACRQRLPASGLVRFVLVDGTVQVDVDRRSGGRGVNLHPTRQCLERASKHGAFGRGFRKAVAGATVERLADEVGVAYHGRLYAYLVSAVARGGAAPVEQLDQVEPAGLRALLNKVEADPRQTDDVPIVRAQNEQPDLPRAAVGGARPRARVERLARVVAEFTFPGGGVIKRRPQPRGSEARQSGDGEPSVPTTATLARTKRPTSEKHE